MIPCMTFGEKHSEPTSGDEFYFQWHITERCNQLCRHCYQIENTIQELSLHDLLKIIDIMESTVSKWDKQGTLSITGGEPFIRRDDLFALMQRLDNSNNFCYYDILTNGSFISKNEVKALVEHSRLRRVQVSLEGASAEVNDEIRGAGSFDTTLKAIRNLRAHDIKVVVMMTITRRNKNQVHQVVDLLNREGVFALALERLIPEGHGADLKHLVLSSDELQNLYNEIYKLSQNSHVRILMHRPLFTMIAPGDPSVGALCSAGNNALTIMPDGTVYPCRRLPISIGNILTDGLFKIWYDSDVLWRLRDPAKLNEKCRNCRLLTQCRGCRAFAYFENGDYMAEDAQCWK